VAAELFAERTKRGASFNFNFCKYQASGSYTFNLTQAVVDGCENVLISAIASTHITLVGTVDYTDSIPTQLYVVDPGPFAVEVTLAAAVTYPTTGNCEDVCDNVGSVLIIAPFENACVSGNPVHINFDPNFPNTIPIGSFGYGLLLTVGFSSQKRGFFGGSDILDFEEFFPYFFPLAFQTTIPPAFANITSAFKCSIVIENAVNVYTPGIYILGVEEFTIRNSTINAEDFVLMGPLDYTVSMQASDPNDALEQLYGVVARATLVDSTLNVLSDGGFLQAFYSLGGLFDVPILDFVWANNLTMTNVNLTGDVTFVDSNGIEFLFDLYFYFFIYFFL